MRRDSISWTLGGDTTPISGSTPLVVYGAGGFGRYVVELASDAGLTVGAVVDRDPETCTWASAISPQAAAQTMPGSPVLIGVFSPGPDVAAIADALAGLGLGPVISPPEFFGWLGSIGVSAERYWLTTDRTLTHDSTQEIENARGLLADDESRSVFDALLAYRRGGGPQSAPHPRPLSEQHTGLDFDFLPSEPGFVIDCGAFTGDTFANWEQAGLQHEYVLALEPDDRNFAGLVATAALSQLRVIPIPAGVAERTGRFGIRGEGPSAVMIPDAAGPTVAVALDELLAGCHSSLIKMDIEGGEGGALRGAVRTLRRDRPRLAISVYHKPWHLWSIVNWLDETIGGYEFRLRVYGHQGYDTVLYATPSKV